MKFRPHDICCILAIAFAIVLFSSDSFAQFTVTVSPSPNPLPATTTAPSGEFKIYASVTNVPTTLEKIVFYRNDVPYKQFVSSATSQNITEDDLGQDNYTYRARAYDLNGEFVDSLDIKISVETPAVFKMGDPAPFPLPAGTPYPTPTPTPRPTSGGNRNVDHTADINAWLAYIKSLPNGGTLYLPCLRTIQIDPPGAPPPYWDTAVYNISNTIVVPANVTIQSENAEEPGQCQIRWFDPNYNYGGSQCNEAPSHQRSKPMFLLEGGTSRVRFKDMSIRSTAGGPNCFPRGYPLEDWSDIAEEETAAFSLKGFTGDIKDVIFENVSITNFTRGIEATTCVPNQMDDGCTDSGYEVSDIKVRGYRPTQNHRNLYIDSFEAYNWDVQGVNNTTMSEDQGSVEIINAGQPSGYTGLGAGLKFLNVNCNGDRASDPAFCMRIEKHGGLYIKQLHHEGVDYALTVENISSRGTNPDPIVMEGSVGTGKFYDASMKLYLIGNAVFTEPEVAAPNLDEGRLVFEGDGKDAEIVDCGDIHWDLTDTHFAEPAPTPTPGHVTIHDLRMQYSHSERNRSSFFIPNSPYQRLDMPHTNCPASSPNIANVGGLHFNTGVMPSEAGLPYSRVMNHTNCPPSTCDAADYLEALMDPEGQRGSVYIDDSFTFERTVYVPHGVQIIGDGTSVLTLDAGTIYPQNVNLFQIDIPIGTSNVPRTSGIVMRNLNFYTEQTDSTGLALWGMDGGVNDISASSDNHFSGLRFEGFTRGIFAGQHEMDIAKGQPMLDGYSWKNLKFVNNVTGVRVFSSNTSNWNVMNLDFESDVPDSRGWDQTGGGSSIQNAKCVGDGEYPMTDCLRFEIAWSYITGLKRTTDVTNAVTIKNSGTVGSGTIYEAYQTSNLILRNSDLRAQSTDTAQMNILGRSFIVSMNNKFDYFNVGTTAEASYSRVTYCGDTPGSESTLFDGLSADFPNKWVGHPTPTKSQCGTNPVTFDDTVKWGGVAGDLPIPGNMYSTTVDDHVFFRPGSTQAKFFIREKDGTRSRVVDWGLPTDLPVIGRFYASTQKSQLVAFRNGVWYVNLPDLEEPISTGDDVTAGWNWGMSGDIPFAGNFFAESGGASNQRDEIAIYRPSTKTFWVMNPRTEYYESKSRGTSDYGTKIQVGDFLGRGYDQIAQYHSDETWYILDLDTGDTATAVLNDPEDEDVPVAGKYFTGTCSQIGVWRPSEEKFIVADPSSGCGGRDGFLVWGLKRGSGDSDNDIPLVMRGADALDHPTAYQKDDDPLFEYNLTKGLWWVHDPIVPN